MDVSMDQAPTTGISSHAQHQHQQQHQQQQPVSKEYFILQKCWYDGPHMDPPVDYLALFEDKDTAVQVATDSAHWFATQRHGVVRTIMLPTGYAFSAAGKLFWIRSVWVNVQADISPYHAACSTGAHAIFAGNVIGGTGNQNSRRGSEASAGVVFVGPDSHRRALNVLMNGGLPCSSRIAHLPFAPLENMLDGWSGDNSHHAQSTVAANALDSLKRTAMQSCNVVVNKEPLPESSDYRPLKRQCGISSHHHHQEQQTSMDAIMRMTS